MTFNKVVHAAVRRDLARFKAALDRFVAGDRSHATALADMYDRFDHELTHHHQSEDKIVWPLLDGAANHPALLGEVEAEHEALAAALASAHQGFDRLRASASAADASATRSAVVELERAATTHFDHEERDVDPLLEQVDQAHWDAAQKQLRKARRPGEVGWMLQWMSDSASPPHAAYMQAFMPRPVRFVFDLIGRRTYLRVTSAAWEPTAVR